MSRHILLGVLFAFSSVTSALADPAADVQAAAKKLTEGGNYSWKSTVEGAAIGGGGAEGKTDKGLTFLTLSIGNMPVEVVMKGDKSAVKMADGWQTLAEVAAAAPAGGAGAGGQPNAGRFIARTLQNYKTPAMQAEELAGQSKDLKLTDDVYSGTLPEDAVKSQLAFGGRGGAANAAGPQIANPKGAVKFWVKDGVITKMVINVQGSISFNGQDRDINRTTTIEIKDVGSTKIEVPEEAKVKAGLDK